MGIIAVHHAGGLITYILHYVIARSLYTILRSTGLSAGVLLILGIAAYAIWRRRR